MKIKWSAAYDLPGIAYGYSTHQKMLNQALQRNGVIMDDDSEIAVHIVTPEVFRPEKGRFNVLYTMYEMEEIPHSWRRKVRMCDLLVVPCRHNAKLFRKYTDGPIEVCNEGVDAELYSYKARQFPTDRPFLFLWVGASNPRKGYEHVCLAWNQFQNQYPDYLDKTLLVMKTTQVAPKEHIIGFVDGKEQKIKMEKERIFTAGNAIVDTRRLPYRKKDGLPGMVDMYHYAHAFLLPSMGEGFGLTLAEAMATGLPCIYTPWSGPEDFVDESVAYPVDYEMRKVRTARFNKRTGKKRPHFAAMAASADVNDIVRKMVHIYRNYDEALEKGRKAANRIRYGGFTWDDSARSFIKILEKYIDKHSLRAA